MPHDFPDWMCAQCLRDIASERTGPIVRCHPTDTTPFYLTPWNLLDSLKKYGTKSFFYLDGMNMPLYAMTVIDNEYRCVIHTQKVH